MTYDVEIDAQVRYRTTIDADSREEAAGKAKEEFEVAQDIGDSEIVIINSVTVRESA